MFDQALRNARNELDVDSICTVVMLGAHSDRVQGDQFWQSIDLAILRGLLVNERKNPEASFRNVRKLLDAGVGELEPVLRDSPEWRDASGNVKTLAVQSVTLLVSSICEVEEALLRIRR